MERNKTAPNKTMLDYDQPTYISKFYFDTSKGSILTHILRTFIGNTITKKGGELRYYWVLFLDNNFTFT